MGQMVSHNCDDDGFGLSECLRECQENLDHSSKNSDSSIYFQKEERSKLNQITYHLKTFQNEDQIKLKVNGRDKLIKIKFEDIEKKEQEK